MRTFWPSSEVERWQRIYLALKGWEDACEGAATPGWIQLGESDALGVFVWATNSDMDVWFPAFDYDDGPTPPVDLDVDGGAAGNTTLEEF